jgi:hypothetical protein
MPTIEQIVSYRGYLEVKEDDGTTAFYETDKILQSPRLQRQCLEKAVLRRIINRLRKAGMLDERPYISLVGDNDG